MKLLAQCDKCGKLAPAQPSGSGTWALPGGWQEFVSPVPMQLCETDAPLFISSWTDQARAFLAPVVVSTP